MNAWLNKINVKMHLKLTTRINVTQSVFKNKKHTHFHLNN